MLTVAQILFFAFLVIAVAQICGCALFVRHLLQARPAAIDDSRLPKAAVALPLMGTDPELLDNIKRLLVQEYPNYELHVVLHSQDDPAATIVARALAETGARNVRVEIFDPAFDPLCLNCSNSKTVQGVSMLDDSFEVFAMVSGSVAAHPTWLRELVAPMALDPTIGATFGNRWYMPSRGDWGSLVRCLWNLSAVPIMYFQNMPWGATMAIRVDAIRRGGLEKSWREVIAVDAAAPGALARQGLSVKFVPNLMMINRDECSLSFCLNFIQRQLTWTRLYHDRWISVIGHAAFTVGLLLLTAALLLYSVSAARFDVVVWTVMGFLIGQAALYVCVLGLDWGVRKSSSHYRWSPSGWLSLKVLLRLPAALLLTQVCHPLTVWRAAVGKYVSWRGVRLEIVGRGRIRNADHIGSAASAQEAESSIR